MKNKDLNELRLSHCKTMLDILALENKNVMNFYYSFTTTDSVLTELVFKKLQKTFQRKLIGDGYWKMFYMRTSSESLTSYFLSHCELPVIVYTKRGKIVNDAATILFDNHVIKKPMIITIINDDYRKIVEREDSLALPNDSFLVRNSFLYNRDFDEFVKEATLILQDPLFCDSESLWYLRYYNQAFGLHADVFDVNLTNWKKNVQRFHEIFVKYNSSIKYNSYINERDADDKLTTFINHRGLLEFNEFRITLLPHF